MIFVVDASAAVKWFVEENGRDKARELLRDGIIRVAPDIILVEVANALRKKVELKEIGDLQARLALDDISLYLPNLIASATVISDAFSLALELKHPVADCLYLACARRSSGQLISADEQFLTKCRENYASFVRSLNEIDVSISDIGLLSVSSKTASD